MIRLALTLRSRRKTVILGPCSRNLGEDSHERLERQETTGDTLIIAEEQKVHAGNDTNGNLQGTALEAEVAACHGVLSLLTVDRLREKVVKTHESEYGSRTRQTNRRKLRGEEEERRRNEKRIHYKKPCRWRELA